jgi:hypothetical protein
MFLLQAEVAAIANTGAGFRGWDLITWGIIVLGLVLLWRITPMLIKRESKTVVEKEVKGLSKESFDRLIRENESVIGETNTIVNKLLDRFAKVEEDLIHAKKEREYFNNTTIERLNVMTDKISDMRSNTDTMTKRISEVQSEMGLLKEKLEGVSLDSLMGTIYNENAPPTERINAFKKYLKGGGNDFCLKWFGKNFILSHKDLWSESFSKPDKLEDVFDVEHYKSCLKYIRDHITHD